MNWIQYKGLLDRLANALTDYENNGNEESDMLYDALFEIVEILNYSAYDYDGDDIVIIP